MITFAVTVGQNKSTELVCLAKKWAQNFGVQYIERNVGTLKDLLEFYNLDCFLIATKNGPELYNLNGRLFFHPGMSIFRIKNLQEGRKDRLIDALSLKEGMSVLDCTMGLASDSCVMSYVVGKTGSVISLEVSSPVSFVIQEGLKTYANKDKDVVEAMRKIEVININAFDYLLNTSDNFFDAIYFDPMFPYEIKGSINMHPLKPVAFNGQISEEILTEAKRVAKNRVVIKMPRNSNLPFANTDKYYYSSDGKYSNVKYAVFEVDL